MPVPHRHGAALACLPLPGHHRPALPLRGPLGCRLSARPRANRCPSVLPVCQGLWDGAQRALQSRLCAGDAESHLVAPHHLRGSLSPGRRHRLLPQAHRRAHPLRRRRPHRLPLLRLLVARDLRRRWQRRGAGPRPMGRLVGPPHRALHAPHVADWPGALPPSALRAAGPSWQGWRVLDLQPRAQAVGSGAGASLVPLAHLLEVQPLPHAPARPRQVHRVARQEAGRPRPRAQPDQGRARVDAETFQRAPLQVQGGAVRLPPVRRSEQRVAPLLRLVVGRGQPHLQLAHPLSRRHGLDIRAEPGAAAAGLGHGGARHVGRRGRTSSEHPHEAADVAVG
mmetsp:Transcript_49580/g.160701  ORF Transcript_49580/g.160701 Transcript_49580/m.160701 type:complete len:338 (+) Transcript_49580:2155-3168(+)